MPSIYEFNYKNVRDQKRGKMRGIFNNNLFQKIHFKLIVLKSSIFTKWKIIFQNFVRAIIYNFKINSFQIKLYFIMRLNGSTHYF